ncbi:heavy-metal-associated domain-containing protein [Sediminibacterium ginsengisoli]|uniref:Heavy-metal-associated domain-containing protein n=1 Tax=Sediminibacterium ginsengisoli TaxID=413434 RepID=A0A1T4MDK5_9BACT|nr:cation transporter [Sediminibacterium ginsengisoli]SJZ65012.1 Heavy-metal-associated domain-containing protein [Sediminibacterium ginsengisoli]
MQNLTFKTNIKCAGCIEKVTPVLDREIGTGKWHVATDQPSKTLTVTSDLTAEKVIALVQSAGFSAEEQN